MNLAIRDSTSIGLDIGSSAVRAAEISVGRDGRRLRRYAQVGLPPGAVVDGEVVNEAVVSEALRRLWTEGGFSSKRVVLGVSGHRVIVRQADVPGSDEEDLRSALRFDAQELIPIPMDQASFDFSILDRTEGVGPNGKSMMRILIVAVHRDLLRNYLAALKGAGLEAVAIDAAPLALMRVLPPLADDEGDNRAEALVAIGAEMTTVAVRQHGVPQFIRSLAVGGTRLTSGIAEVMHVDNAVAERMKRDAMLEGSPQLIQVRGAITTELRDLADDVKATVDFFVGQSDGAPVGRLLVTGGAAQTRGLIEALASDLNVQVLRIDPFAGLNLDQLGLDETQTQKAQASAATAVGLALWRLEPPGVRLSVLPEEFAEARRARRIMMMAGAGVAGVAAVLGVAVLGQAATVHKAQDQVTLANEQVSNLQAKVTSLQTKTAVHQKLQTQQNLVVTALTGDIDWVRVIAQARSLIPRNLTVGNVTGAKTIATTGAASGTGTASVGILTFSVTGTGGLPAVAAWLQALQRDHSLAGTWVSGVSVVANGGAVTFSSSTDMTQLADSNRAKAVKP